MVDELARKIARSKTDTKAGLMEQTSAQLEKVRKFAVGPDRKKLTPHTAHRINGEYMMRASQLEEAILQGEIDEGSSNEKVTTLKEAVLPVPTKKLVELQPELSKKLAKLHGIDEARGTDTDPAWTVFFYEAGLKHAAMPDFNADEWYGEAMSSRSSVLRKLVLPMVAFDMLDKAAQESIRPMPNKKIYMEHTHRAINALIELIELWETEMPAIADKYRAVKDALDREQITLSLYYRYQERE